MLKMSRHLSWFAQRGAVYLYHDLYGYLMQMSADLKDFVEWFDDGRELDGALENFADVFGGDQVRQFVQVFGDHACLVPQGEDELTPLLDAYPVRGRWALAANNADGEVRVVVGRNPEVAPRIVTLSPWQVILWRLADGERTCAQMAAELAQRTADDLPPDADREAHASQAVRRTLTTIAAWTHSEVQWTRISKQPMSFFGGQSRPPPYLSSTMPYARLEGTVASDPFEEGGVFDLRAYHRESITNADAQFDEVETTLSHLFRVPHPALGGATYASRMADALVSRGLASGDTKAMVEVGGGTGYFAAGLLNTFAAHHAQVYEELDYKIVDISPTLQESQRSKLGEHDAVVELLQTDGEALDLPPDSVDLLISNEVIADFRTARVRRADLEDDPPVGTAADEGEPTDPEAAELLVKYDVPLHEAPEHFCVNLGAIRFLEGVHRVLRPGGAALITEFGDLHRYPVESTHLDHPEFSIHFGHLLHVAGRLGFEAEVVEVLDLLAFDPDVMVLSSTRTWFRNLVHLAAAHDVQLSKIAWTPEMLHEVCGDRLDIRRIEYLSWRPVGERVMGLAPREFKALIVRKGAEQ